MTQKTSKQGNIVNYLNKWNYYLINYQNNKIFFFIDNNRQKECIIQLQHNNVRMKMRENQLGKKLSLDKFIPVSVDSKLDNDYKIQRNHKLNKK